MKRLQKKKTKRSGSWLKSLETETRKDRIGEKPRETGIMDIEKKFPQNSRLRCLAVQGQSKKYSEKVSLFLRKELNTATITP